MPAFTTNQWAIVFLVLVAGWLLGLLSSSAGRKWKRAYEAEQEARAAERQDYQARLDAAESRVAELERARPVAPPIMPHTAPVTTASTLDLRSDDLAAIRGIGRAGAARLNDQGIHRYADITAMSAAEEADLERRMGADPGYIEQEHWREQAMLLQDGKIDEHRQRFA